MFGFPVIKACPAYRQHKTLTWFSSPQASSFASTNRDSLTSFWDLPVSVTTQTWLALPSGTLVQLNIPPRIGLGKNPSTLLTGNCDSSGADSPSKDIRRE